MNREPDGGTETMSAIRLVSPRGVGGLVVEQVGKPQAGPGEALVRVHAAAITRDELEWPVDRLPAIPSYELSGVIEALGPNVPDLAAGDAVWALTGFDRDGAAAEYAVVPASFLAPKPRTLGHVESAAIPLAGLTAWQGLFGRGRLRNGERVLIHWRPRRRPAPPPVLPVAGVRARGSYPASLVWSPSMSGRTGHHGHCVPQ